MKSIDEYRDEHIVQSTYSTASHTLSQEVWNASAVSFQESFRAQRARNSI
jgi:hypothetical protein